MRNAVVLAGFLWLGHVPLGAQTLVTSGQTVRITSTRYELNDEIGRVLAVAPDTILIESKGIRTVKYRQVLVTDTVALPIAAIDRLEVSARTGHQTGRGALVGLEIGAGAGFIIGLAAYEPCAPEQWCVMQPTSSVQNAIMGSLAFGVIGAGVGALIGSTIRGDKWEERPLHSQLSMQPLPQHRLGLGVTTSF